MGKCTALTLLSLASNCLGAEEVGGLLSGLGGCGALAELDLSGNLLLAFGV